MKRLMTFLVLASSMLAQITTQTQGRIGPVAGSDSGVQTVRLAKTGESVTSDAHGRYYEAAIRGTLFFASNQAGIATPVGLTTASKNFTLYNPAGSGKNLVLLDITVQATADPAADTAIWLVGNLTATQAAPATNTAETVRNGLLGGAAGVGLVYNTTTLASTPVILRALPGVFFASGVGSGQIYARDEVAGSIIIPPGVYVSVQGLTAITLVCSMAWEEVSQ